MGLVSPRRFARLSLGLAIGLTVALAGAARAKVAEAAVPLDLAGGSFKSIKLANIPAATRLRLEVSTDGPVAILLLDEADYARFPDPLRPVFRGATSDSLTASVRAPRSGHYFVVIDNREGHAERAVEVSVRGETGDGGETTAGGEAQFAEFQRRLNQLFRFQPFAMRIGACPARRSFTRTGGTVLLCQGYIQRLHGAIGDRARTQDVLLFALFHESGHQLLRQWEHPGHAGEATADEFALALMRILGQEEKARDLAGFVRDHAARLGAVAAAFDDSHVLSESRARQLARFANDPRLLDRWQPLLVSRMQTPVLERLEAHPLPWTNPAVVDAELARRR